MEITSFIALTHAVLGSTALAFGAWLVGAWRFRKDFSGCFGRKRLMIPTLTVWLSTLTFGIILYSIFIMQLVA
jgi:hypothetical protein